MTKYKTYEGILICISDDAELVKSTLKDGNAAVMVLNDGNLHLDTSFAKYAVLEENGEVNISDNYLKKIAARHMKKPLVIAKTKRLVIRELCTADAKSLTSIISKEGSSFFGEVFKDPEDTREVLQSYSENVYDLFEYGIYAVCLKEGEMIGVAGFTSRDENDIELGYAIDSYYRRMGYGFEACKAVIEYANDNIEYRNIIIETDHANEAGCALRKKIRRELNV